MAKKEVLAETEKTAQELLEQQGGGAQAEAETGTEESQNGEEAAKSEEVTTKAEETSKTEKAAKIETKQVTKKDEKAARVDEIKARFKVDTVYENTKGEFFTSHNLAVLSEGNDKTKITTHK